MRKLEKLDVKTEATEKLPLAPTAQLLGLDETSVRRYFWGLATKKGGKPLKKGGKQLVGMETQLRQKIEAFSQRPTQAVAPSLEAATKGVDASLLPSEVRAVPLLTTRTASGLAAIYDFGDLTATGVSGPEWKYRNHLSNDQNYVQLRPRMRGRHVFGRKAGALANRCFEWVVKRDGANSGRPLFKISEFSLGSNGFRKSSKAVEAPTPSQAWEKLYEELLHLPAPRRGAQLCGFHDSALVPLLALHNLSKNQYGLKPAETLGSRSTRWEREFAAAASGTFRQAMESVCPTDPALAFTVMRRSASWQAEWLGPDDTHDSILDHPFIVGTVDAHHHAPQASNFAILSLVAPHFPVKVTCDLFNVKPRDVTAAKIHDADAMAGQPFEKPVLQRMRLSPRTFAFLHSWCRSSFAVTAGDASSAKLKRLEIQARLYKRYVAMAESELGVNPVSQDCFNKHMQDGFEDDTVESCCCGGCCDGWAALSMLKDFIEDPAYEFPDRKGLSKQVDQIGEFLKSDYRWKHLRESSKEAMHCMQHALCCSCASLCQACEHEHVNTCVECNQLPILLAALIAHTREWTDRQLEMIQTRYQSKLWQGWHSRNDHTIHGLPARMIYGSQEWLGWCEDGKPTGWDCPEVVPVEQQVESMLRLRESMLEHIQLLEGELHRYRAHLVRKHKASQGRMDLLSQVSDTRALVFIDYKQKVLPAENREAQSKSFGKKGKSLFGMVAMFKLQEGFQGEIPDGIDIDGDYAISYFKAYCDDADQDYSHSVQCTEIGCKYLKKQYPWLMEILLYSDGAGNFRSLSYELLMAKTVAAVGLRVVCHLLPEAGDGKDRVDRDFAGINQLFWSYLKQPGASMQNAVEMAKALDYGQKKGDGVVNCALEIARVEGKVPSVDTEGFAVAVGKARDNMYYTKFEFTVDSDGSIKLAGARFYAYYEMGEGVHLDASALSKLWPGKRPTRSASIIYGASVGDMSEQRRPKTERSKANEKAHKESKAAAKQAKKEATAQKAAIEEAAVAARRFSRRCITCDRKFLRKAPWLIHSAVCKARGGKLTKAMKEATALRDNRFDSLQGCEVQVKIKDEFPIPQNNGYTALQTLDSCLLSWRERLQMLNGKKYDAATSVVPSRGWATKESCRRPAERFTTDVVSILRWCFDAKPRLNNYQIQNELKRKFKIGPKVLRISQVSGWVR